MIRKDDVTSTMILEKTLRTVAPLPSQAEYAKNLAAMFSMHLHRNQLINQGFSADELPMVSAIVVAPTGQGKTFLLRKMAEALGLNVITIDCSTLAAEGWRGISLSQRLTTAMQDAKEERAFMQSVLFFDEVDKLRLWGTKNDQGNAMSNILQLFNGGTIALELDKRIINVDVGRFAILMGGAFVGIEEIVQERICPKARIGFSSQTGAEIKTKAQLFQAVNADDLAKFGLMPELLGRVGSILTIPPLELEDYRQLLDAQAGSLRRKYNNYLSLYSVPFEIAVSGVEAIARKCMAASTGARAVNPLVDGLMRQAIVYVENDERINRVILDADGDECCIRYEYGPRICAVQKEAPKEEPSWHTVKAKNTPALVRKLCRYYRNAGGNQRVTEQLEVFLNCAVPYLLRSSQDSEFTFEALEELASAAYRKDGANSFDERMRRSFRITSDAYAAFQKANDFWLARNVMSALGMILGYIHKNHGKRKIKFRVPKGK